MVDSARMLSFDDERWNHLKGGYKTPFDPRPSLQKLESQQDTATAWRDLWEDLHHQGDVGDASYASLQLCVLGSGLVHGNCKSSEQSSSVLLLRKIRSESSEEIPVHAPNYQ
jgi:hypothetical protein